MGKIYRSKWFYCVLAMLAIADIAFVLHICCSYESIIRPILPRLIEENKIGNTVDGANWLAYFTILSNLFVTAWFLMWFVGKTFKVEALVGLSENTTFTTCVTLYIFVTGLLYTGSTVFGVRWFDKGDGAAIVNNVVNVYHHFIIPPLATIIYFTMPVQNKKSSREVALTAMIFPVAYLAFSLIRGKIINWYAYPIFRPEALWCAVFPDKEYAFAPAVCLLLSEMLLLTLFFFASAYLMISVQNKRFDNAEMRRIQLEYVKNGDICGNVTDNDTISVGCEESKDVA